ELDESASSDGLIGRSKPMRQLRQLIKSVAPTDANVLITGENGTGKEVVATVIHQSSKRAAGPFIKVNCAAIPNDLIESELFGHKRGAFTGAVNDKQDLMDMATHGPLLPEYLLRKFATQHERPITAFHPDAIRTLVDYAWPGNVRELQHIVERAVILAKGAIIGVDDLPDEVREVREVR